MSYGRTMRKKSATARSKRRTRRAVRRQRGGGLPRRHEYAREKNDNARALARARRAHFRIANAARRTRTTSETKKGETNVMTNAEHRRNPNTISLFPLHMFFIVMVVSCLTTRRRGRVQSA